MSSFRIKYLSEFPVYAYDSPEMECPDVNLKPAFYEVIKTSENWGHVFDNNITNRTIQYRKYEVYETILLAASNLDIMSLSIANHVLITPEEGEPFYAVNVKIEKKDTLNRDSLYTLTFQKEISINYELLSDFAERLYPLVSADQQPNEINFQVKNMSYVQRTNITATANSYKFVFVKNELTDKISVGQYMYAHVNNSEFDNETFYYVKCVSESSEALYFEFQTTGIPSWWGNSEIILNHEAGANTTPNVTDITVTFLIYTFLKPTFFNDDENEEKITKKDGLEFSGKTLSYDSVKLVFWLSDEEKYKAKYLKFATKIVLYLTGYDTIIPITKYNSIKNIENKRLVKCHEFEFTGKYNFMNVNNARTNIL